MLGVETLAVQTLATSARETPYALRFAEVQRAAVYDLIYLVELEPYLPAAPLYEPPRPRFTYTGTGGGIPSGIASYYYQAPEPGQVRGDYIGAGGAMVAGAAASQYLAAAPAPLPTVPGLWAHYDADRFAGSITSLSDGHVTAWADSSGVTAGAPDIGVALDFSALTEDADLTFARASTKQVFRSGPAVAMTASGHQALTRTKDGLTNLGILLEGPQQQLLENSKWAGGGTTPTGWSTPISGTRMAVASVWGNADGAAAYRMVASTERPYHYRPMTFADSTTYVMSVLWEAGSHGSPMMQVIGSLGTGGVGTTQYSGAPASFPTRISMSFTTGTGNTLSSVRFGPGCTTTVSADVTISRPSIVAMPVQPFSWVPSDNGTTPTQPADVGTVALNAGNWSDTANTIVIRARTAPFMGSAVQVAFQIDKANYADCYRLYRATDKHLHFTVRTGSIPSVDQDLGLIDDSTDFTLRIATATNNCRMSLNGGAVVQDTTVTMPTAMTVLRLGSDSVQQLNWFGTVAIAETWKSAKPDSELQTGIIFQGAGGGGPVLAQTVVARSPLLLRYGQAGRDTVDFTSASANYLVSAASPSFDAFWTGGAYALIGARIEGLGSQSAGRLVARNAGGGGWYISLQAGTAGNAQLVMNVGYTTTPAIYATADFVLSPLMRIVEVSFDTATPSTPPVIRIDGTTLSVRIVQAASGSYSEAVNSPIAFSDATYAFEGEMADVLFYGQVPIASDQTALRSWATTKWQTNVLPPPPPPSEDPIRDNLDQPITDELGGGIV